MHKDGIRGAASQLDRDLLISTGDYASLDTHIHLCSDRLEGIISRRSGDVPVDRLALDRSHH